MILRCYRYRCYIESNKPFNSSSDIQLTSLAMEERKLPGASGAIHKLARARHALSSPSETTLNYTNCKLL